MQVVFVYGTLKRGFWNHRLLDRDGARFLGNAATVGTYPMITDDYFIPYVLNVPEKGHSIKGELYLVNSDVLFELDILENHPDWYRRERIPVKDITLAQGDAQGDGSTSSGTQSCGANESPDLTLPWMYLIPQERVTAEQLAKDFIDCYQPDDHRLKYVPRAQRAKHPGNTEQGS